jgi:hypothetical protein
MLAIRCNAVNLVKKSDDGFNSGPGEFTNFLVCNLSA